MHVLFVDHRPQVIICNQLDLVDFGRGAEAIEEVQEWHPRFKRRGVAIKAISWASWTELEASKAKPVERVAITSE